MVPTSLQKPLSSSSESLQSMPAAGPEQFLDEIGGMDEVLALLLIFFFF